MKIKYLNKEEYIQINMYMISEDMIFLSYPNIEENLSGFIMYDDNDKIMRDCSDFIYRWNVLDDNPDRIYYTNIPDYVQTTPFSERSDEEFEEITLSEEEREKQQLQADINYLLMLNE